MERLTDLALRWPLLTIGLAIALSVTAGLRATGAESSSGAHALLGASHSEVQRLERFLARFGGGYPVVVAWSCGETGDPCRSALDAASLAMAHAVGEELLQEAHVLRVSSPAHTPILLPSSDGIRIHRLFDHGRADLPHGAIRAALSDPVWKGTLVSTDGRTGGLLVESSSTTPEDQVALVSAIERATAPYDERGFRFALSGNPFFHVASQREAMAEAALIGGATAAVIAACFLALLRSWQSVVGLMSAVGLATGFGLGTIALFGWPWDPLTSAAPTLVLVMGSADAVHYLTAYWRSRSAGVARHLALRAATHETWIPCAMTAATSMAGLVSFVGTPSIGFAHFGAVTAVGVGASLLMTFTVLPAVLICLPDSRGPALREYQRWEQIVPRLIALPVQHTRLVLFTSALLAGVGGYGLTKLNTDAHPLSYWREGHPTRAAIEFVSSRLTSIEGVEIALELPHEVEQPGAVSRLRWLEESLQGLPGVRGVRSFRTVLESAAHALGAESLDEQNAGEIVALVSLSDPTALDPWLSLDHRFVRISVSAESAGVESREKLLAGIDLLAQRLPPTWGVELTGASVLQRSIDRVVRDSALQALSGTTLVVSALVMLFLGSVKWGALAMIPNVLPIVVLFGLMGLSEIALDAGTALVAPIAIGIAVDDTIHFLHEFGAQRRQGLGPLEASRRAGVRVGRAIVTTSGTLSAGFLAMLVSRFQSMANIGLLSAAAIVAAFAAELFVLPALITLFAERAPSAASASRSSA
jgi:hypothetical protein